MTMTSTDLDHLTAALARIQNSRVVEYHDEDTRYRMWSHGHCRVEAWRGAWRVSAEMPLGFREFSFAELVTQVSCRVRLGVFVRPKHVDALDRHVFAMMRCLRRFGWAVESANSFEVVVRKDDRKVTFSCERGNGLMLAVAILILLLKNIKQ